MSSGSGNRLAAELEITSAMTPPAVWLLGRLMVFLDTLPDFTEVDDPVIFVIDKDVPSEYLDLLSLDLLAIPVTVGSPVNEKVIFVVGDGIFIAVMDDFANQIPPSVNGAGNEFLVIGAVKTISH